MSMSVRQLHPSQFPSPLSLSTQRGDSIANYTRDHDSVLLEVAGEAQRFELAGPRSQVAFQSSNVRAGILTCGGLCPGLNNVIRSVVNCLYKRYAVRSILGFHYGYFGLSSACPKPPTRLTPQVVSDIHHRGGSFLGSSGGPQSIDDMMATLQTYGINQLYCIGGDGTMRGADALAKGLAQKGIKLSVIGIPKTIDNDIPFVERTFGFDTAISIAAQAIEAAQAEAMSALRGVGLVKVMGRHAGFIAAQASLAARDVDLVLVPELPCQWGNLSAESTNPQDLVGILPYVRQVLDQQGHAVIVLAEGVGSSKDQPLLHTHTQAHDTDASGNRKLPEIGIYMKQKLIESFEAIGQAIQLKYIDPSYMIRATVTSSFDAIYCAQLAENAVHAAMAGKSEMLIGLWGGQATHVPFDLLTGKEKRINLDASLWRSVLDVSGQPVVLSF